MISLLNIKLINENNESKTIKLEEDVPHMAIEKIIPIIKNFIDTSLSSFLIVLEEDKSLFFYRISNNILSMIDSILVENDDDTTYIKNISSIDTIDYEMIIGLEIIIGTYETVIIKPLKSLFVKVSHIDLFNR